MYRKCSKCCSIGGCDNCPPIPIPVTLNNSSIRRQISKKMERAHFIRTKGTFFPANRHTANLPGTIRPVIPKDASGSLIWPCNADIHINQKTPQ